MNRKLLVLAAVLFSLTAAARAQNSAEPAASRSAGRAPAESLVQVDLPDYDAEIRAKVDALRTATPAPADLVANLPLVPEFRPESAARHPSNLGPVALAPAPVQSPSSARL